MKTSSNILAEIKLAYQKQQLSSLELETKVIEYAEMHRKEQLCIGSVSERFSSEGEILQWLYLNTPFAIKPKSKHAKTLLVNPFTSNHAFEEVCKHLANKLYNAR